MAEWQIKRSVILGKIRQVKVQNDTEASGYLYLEIHSYRKVRRINERDRRIYQFLPRNPALLNQLQSSEDSKWVKK